MISTRLLHEKIILSSLVTFYLAHMKNLSFYVQKALDA